MNNTEHSICTNVQLYYIHYTDNVENLDCFHYRYDMTRVAAERLFGKTNRKPSEVQVVELHDCFSANELITYEALGLCPPGKAGELIDRGDTTYGGKYVINPSGGLISKGIY